MRTELAVKNILSVNLLIFRNFGFKENFVKNLVPGTFFVGTDTEKYGWMGFIAIILLFFVLYRNKLQFSGWYKGKGREKLPKNVYQILIFSGVVLLLLPPAISLLLIQRVPYFKKEVWLFLLK